MGMTDYVGRTDSTEMIGVWLQGMRAYLKILRR